MGSKIIISNKAQPNKDYLYAAPDDRERIFLIRKKKSKTFLSIIYETFYPESMLYISSPCHFPIIWLMISEIFYVKLPVSYLFKIQRIFKDKKFFCIYFYYYSCS